MSKTLLVITKIISFIAYPLHWWSGLEVLGKSKWLLAKKLPIPLLSQHVSLRANKTPALVILTINNEH